MNEDIIATQKKISQFLVQQELEWANKNIKPFEFIYISQGWTDIEIGKIRLVTCVADLVRAN